MILEDYKKLTPRNGRYSQELLEKKLNFINDFLNIK